MRTVGAIRGPVTTVIASLEQGNRGFEYALCDSRPALILYRRHAVTVARQAGGFPLARPADQHAPSGGPSPASPTSSAWPV